MEDKVDEMKHQHQDVVEKAVQFLLQKSDEEFTGSDVRRICQSVLEVLPELEVEDAVYEALEFWGFATGDDEVHRAVVDAQAVVVIENRWSR